MLSYSDPDGHGQDMRPVLPALPLVAHATFFPARDRKLPNGREMCEASPSRALA